MTSTELIFSLQNSISAHKRGTYITKHNWAEYSLKEELNEINNGEELATDTLDFGKGKDDMSGDLQDAIKKNHIFQQKSTFYYEHDITPTNKQATRMKYDFGERGEDSVSDVFLKIEYDGLDIPLEVLRKLLFVDIELEIGRYRIIIMKMSDNLLLCKAFGREIEEGEGYIKIPLAIFDMCKDEFPLVLTCYRIVCIHLRYIFLKNQFFIIILYTLQHVLNVIPTFVFDERHHLWCV